MTLVGEKAKELFINKFGFQPAQTQTEQTVWTGTPGIYAYPPVAAQMLIASTSSLDATTGAKTGTLFGINSAFNLAQETIVFSGSLHRTTNEFFIRTYRFEVESAGSLGKNVGEICVGVGSAESGIPNSMYMHIPSGDNQSLSAFYTVPKDYEGHIDKIHFSCGGNDIIEGELYVKPFGSVFKVKARLQIFRNTNTIEYESMAIEAKSDVELRAIRISAGGNVRLEGLFEVHLELKE